ncbi:MAG: S41 family peptidase [Flavipsychrobacter sp.]
MPRFYYLLLLLLSLTACRAQQGRNVHDTHSREDYVADLHLLADSLWAHHPQPFAFISEPDFRQLVAEKEAMLTDKTTISAFAWICRSVTAAVGCGHTDVFFKHKMNLKPSMYFPMIVSYVDEHLYVIDPLENKDNIKAGTELLSINGVSVLTLRDQLRQHIPADGYNVNMTDWFIHNEFYSLCAYQLQFPKQYTVVAKTEGGTQEIALTATTKEPKRITYLNNCFNGLCFSVDEAKQLATITIRNFVFYDKELPKFKSFVDNCFEQIKQQDIQHVVLDLRDNRGGDPYCAVYLLQHLNDAPFQYYQSGTSMFYKDLQEKLQPLPNKFSGDLYVLTNGGCFSTTGHLCALMQEHNIGLFVGQETGATYTCNANNQNIYLPHTALFASSATQTFVANTRATDKSRGIAPHYPVAYTLQDLLHNRDAAMETVFSLIDNKTTD